MVAFLSILFALTAAPVQPAASPLDPALVRSTLESLAAVVNREYFDPQVAAKVDAALRAGLADARYGQAQSPEELAKQLTRALLDETHDKHLSVAVASAPPGANASSDASRETFVRRTNAGVQRAEILPGNVGYLNITHFYRLGEAKDAISAAMGVLQRADALILDLRRNGGGSPETVALLMSHLFDAPDLPLFEIVPRTGDTTRYATDKEPVPGRNGIRPVYALTAHDTFSGGEGIAFLLQERHRALVIGETTAGAANPGRPYPVNDQFNVTVPNGRLRSAVGGGNWEAKGVVPDIPTNATDALRVAHTRALGDLLKTTPNGPWRDQLERELKGLDSKP